VLDDDDEDVMTLVLGVEAVTGIGSGGAVVEGSRRCLRLGRSVSFYGVRLTTAILGTCASYKRMAAGGHYPEV
jgi:hypothetical protein